MAEVLESENIPPIPPQEAESVPATSSAQAVESKEEDSEVAKDPLVEKIAARVKQAFLPEDGEFLLAKNYLGSKMGVRHPVSMYDHLTSIIMHSLESKNANLVDNFEKLSLSIKNSQYAGPTSVKEVKENHIQHIHAKQRLEQLKHSEEGAADSDLGDIPDIMDLASLWEWAGVSFGKEDTFLLCLSIKKLVEKQQLKSVRLWGKIYGRKANYIVAEAELKEGVEDVDEAAANSLEPVENLDTSFNTPLDSKTPTPKVKKFAPLAKENRSGLNKYIYYACHYVGGSWIRLPDVIPERLQESRKIRKYFTGVLDTKIVSFPSFNGNEAQYLRCQIARISAATVVSPKGYYMVDPDAEDSEDSNATPPIVINPEYEGIPNDQLVNISNWVHHIPFVLPQGKAIWETPRILKEEAVTEGEEKEEEEEEEEEVVIEPEQGPSPLSPISADEGIALLCAYANRLENASIPSWTSRICSKLSPIKFSPVSLRSNKWPGANVLAYSDKFANIYIGDGLKDTGSFKPPILGKIEKEFVPAEATPEALVEQFDPTIEAETAFEDSKKVKEDEGKEGGVEGEEGGEEDD